MKNLLVSKYSVALLTALSISPLVSAGITHADAVNTPRVQATATQNHKDSNQGADFKAPSNQASHQNANNGQNGGNSNQGNTARNNLINNGGNFFNANNLSQFSNKDLVNLNHHFNDFDSDKVSQPADPSAVAASIKDAWKSLPSSVKSSITDHTSEGAFLKLVKHGNGTEDQIITGALKAAGLSNSDAQFSAHVLELFIG